MKLNKQKYLLAIIMLLTFFQGGMGYSRGAGLATPLALSAGQEIRLDLPLDPQKTYEISINLRSDVSGAEVYVTLGAFRSSNEFVEYQTIKESLPQDGSWQEIVFKDVKTFQTNVPWELVLSTNVEGRYYWQGLKVSRVSGGEVSIQEYWSEKLQTQGPFYTGLVVDARGLNLQRGMSPKIYSEQGQLIYGGVLASQELVQERGVVAYGTELTDELLERLQVDPDYPYTAPLIVRAIGVSDPAKTSVRISEADTKRILEAMAQYDFFARYAVILLVD